MVTRYLADSPAATGIVAVCPHGAIAATVSAAGVVELNLVRGAAHGPVVDILDGAPGRVFTKLRKALERYIAGKPEDFRDVPLDLRGTAFQVAVWEAARTFAWGERATYAELAERMGRSRGSARAIGQALGANPVPIIVPCHRFIAADGSLGGFSCGLDWKRFLLALEGME